VTASALANFAQALRSRGLAAGIHLLLSCVVAALTGWLVLWLWYPFPYDVLAGGRGLFWLVVSVDVVMGPLLTLVVFNKRKPRRELVRDLAVIGILQLAALAYGLGTVHAVRPVALVFEVDSFRVVTAFDVRTEELPQARPEYRVLPLADRWLLGARASVDVAEKAKALDLALQGYDIGQRPTYWQSYDASRPEVLRRSRAASLLLRQYPQAQADIRARLAALDLTVDSARFLPVNARTQGWSAVLRTNGDLAGFVPYDGYF
jgi:hypothetical protein